MGLAFERGDKQRPKGHALLYFRSNQGGEEVWATYLMALPISVDVSKYVPPFLTSQIANLSSSELSAFAFPPVPEKLGRYQDLQKLAELRDDDVLYGGALDTSDVGSLLFTVNEIARSYAEAYTGVAANFSSPSTSDVSSKDEPGYKEVVYGLMGPGDRLAELSKLVGKLRYAVEGKDQKLADEAEADIKGLAKYLNENSRVDQILEAARLPGEGGSRLADLYVKRCYLIAKEDYENLRRLEEDIKSLETPPQS